MLGEPRRGGGGQAARMPAVAAGSGTADGTGGGLGVELTPFGAWGLASRAEEGG